MEENSNKIEYITGALKSCLCPPLIHDLGFDNIDSRHFKEFREMLDLKLMEIFDFVQANEDFILDSDLSSLEIQRDFVLLMSEQTAPGTLFQTNNTKLLDNLMKLVDRYHLRIVSDERVMTELLKYYEKNLLKNAWKKNLGAVHGFVQFCEVTFARSRTKMDTKFCSFALSVALSLLEFYEPVYKQLAITLFMCILTSTSSKHLTETNINEVIYDSVYGNIQKIDGKSGIEELWKCLLICVNFTNIKEFSKWTKLDDLITSLIRQINIQSDSRICCYFFQTISKLIAGTSKKPAELNSFIKLNNSESITQLRLEVENLELHGSYRHAKTIMKLLVAEAYRIQNSVCVEDFLNAIHTCYLICIYHIPLKIIQKDLNTFLGKFIPALLQGILPHRTNAKAKVAAKSFLETLAKQLEDPQEDENLLKFRKSIERIMEHDVFALQK